MATKPAVLVAAAVCAGLLWQYVSYGLGAAQAELDAQRAVITGVRTAQGLIRRADDQDVTLVQLSPVSLPAGSRWSIRLKKVTWTYRPWRGAHREAFTFTVCFGSGALFADARLRNARWVVQVSPATALDCPRDAAP